MQRPLTAPLEGRNGRAMRTAQERYPDSEWAIESAAAGHSRSQQFAEADERPLVAYELGRYDCARSQFTFYEDLRGHLRVI